MTNATNWQDNEYLINILLQVSNNEMDFQSQFYKDISNAQCWIFCHICLVDIFGVSQNVPISMILKHLVLPMAILVVQFQAWDTKLDEFLAKNKHVKR